MSTSIRLILHVLFSCVQALRDHRGLRPLKNNSESKRLPGLDTQSLYNPLLVGCLFICVLPTHFHVCPT